MLTPYLGQLLLLRQQLEKHTVVQLEEADAKLLDELAERKDPAQPSPLGSTSEQGTPAGMAADAGVSVKRSTLRSKLRLATVDNFQGLVESAVITPLVRPGCNAACRICRHGSPFARGKPFKSRDAAVAAAHGAVGRI